MTFIEKLEYLCWERGLSERALAKHIGFDQSAISRWRNRGSAPRPGVTKKLADFFQIPVDTLLDETKDLPPSSRHTFLASAAATADKAFPKNSAAGQALFEAKLYEGMRKRELAQLANFLRAKAKALRKEATELEKKATALDAEIER